MEKADTLIETEWTGVTKSELVRVLDTERIYAPAQINQRVHQLILARKALMDARLQILHARKWFVESKDTKTRDRLGSIAAALQTEHDRFPLTILKGANNRKRPDIVPMPEEPNLANYGLRPAE